MAIITLGSTIRGGTFNPAVTATLPGIAIKNTSLTTSIMLGITHGVAIAPGTVRFFTTNDYDDRIRYNPRAHNVNTVSTDGKKPYLDDVNELAKMIANGSVALFTATQIVSSGTFTLGTSAAFTVYGDGSVVFN